MKCLFILLALLGPVIVVKGQEEAPAAGKRKAVPVYFRALTGYGGTISGQEMLLEHSVHSIMISGKRKTLATSPPGNTAVTTEVSKASYGAGLHLALAGGVMLGKHFGIELGFQTLLSPVRYESILTNTTIPDVRIQARHITRAHRQMYLIPAIVIMSGGNLSLFGRLGVVVPVSDDISYTRHIEVQSGTSTTEVSEARYKLSHRFSPGLQAAVGFSYPVSPRWSLQAEVTGLFRDAYADKLEMTAYEVNGESRIQNLTPYNTITEFEPEGTIPQSPVSAAVPRKEPTSSVPFSSLGGGLGVTFSL